MIWKNLAEFKCPHCSAALTQHDGEDEIVCTKCRFVISRPRFESIKANRSGEPVEVVRMKWQNLHDNNCPICEKPLNDDKLKRCSDPDCKFAISEYKFKFILNDPDHPANKFFWKRNIVNI